MRCTLLKHSFWMIHGNALKRSARKVRVPYLSFASVSSLAGYLKIRSLARIVVSLDDLKQLMQQAIAILKTEATVVDLPAPCKVFGDIHGQFTDLKKFFATYGESS